MGDTTFKCTGDTFVKKEPKASSQLESSQKLVKRKDEILDVDSVEQVAGNYYKVRIKVDAPYNYNGLDVSDVSSVYIYCPHWGIVETDDEELLGDVPKTDNPAVKRQFDRLSKYLDKGRILDIDVSTNYYSQRDNYTMSHRTCNSSSNAMYLDWLMAVTKGKRLGGDDGYLKTVLSHGDTIYHGVQTQALRDYGYNTKWMTDADYPFVEDLLTEGFPVVANILHRGSQCAPRGGHIIMLIGKKSGRLIAHDPYGTLCSNYGNTDGKFSQIKESEFKIRWQGGYRILA